MQSFISKVLDDVLEKDTDLVGHCFVLPNKRSALFLKNELRRKLNPNSFFPAILSIEEFMERLSGYQVLDRVGLLFEFYSVFNQVSRDKDKNSFESFAKWGHILLQDFNELDGNLTAADAILTYIYEARRVENWNVDGSGQSTMVSNYISFHKLIPIYYNGLQNRMHAIRAGYQGFVYKRAFETIQEAFGNLNGKSRLFADRFVFAGFNALGKAEEKVIQLLLENDTAAVYWDDDSFYEHSGSSAGSFMDSYRKQWPYYRTNEFKWTGNSIDSQKVIHLHGLPKNISQIKHIGSLLKSLKEQGLLKDTALILGNEKLLPALLSSLPEEVSEANITMGYELQNVALSTFFDTLFRAHLNRSAKQKGAFYYRDLQMLFNDPQLKTHCLTDPDFQKNWDRLLLKEKRLFVRERDLLELVSKDSKLSEIFALLFTNWDQEVNFLIQKMSSIVEWFRKENHPDRLELEILFRFYSIFSQLLNFNTTYGHIVSLKALHQFFRQILQMEKMSFQGEPLSGLQIMGLLESRVVDFDTVILTSVNEGFLPSGRSDNSFIPLDIKVENNLPIFKEKEAIFSYHFFRLLHRARRVYLVYNNITDDFGSGEPSRFLKQLEVAKKLGYLDKVSFEKKSIQPRVVQNPLELKTISKTGPVIDKLVEIAGNGFSPTAFTTYIRNPIDYYKRYVLGIPEHEKVEETMAANTFGTVIHNTLEKLYRPCVDQYLTPGHLSDMLKNLEAEIEKEWAITYSSKAIRSGKNYLSFEIAKQFLVNFLRIEKASLDSGARIRILGLEERISCLHKSPRFNFDIRLKGTIDRIDEFNGVRRIVDYKTGKVSSTDMNVRDWEKLITEEKHSKAFQVMMYAYMYLQDHPGALKDGLPLESGIISFKNLNSGFLKVNGNPVTSEVLEEFKMQLDLLLSAMFSIDSPFEEKELQQNMY